MVRTNIKSKIALVRGPIVYKANAINNEATPAIGFAYITGYLKKFGYDPIIVDAIAEGLNKTWPLKKYPGYYCQGIKYNDIIELIPDSSDVIGFSGMFSGEWPILRDLIFTVRESFPKALIVTIFPSVEFYLSTLVVICFNSNLIIFEMLVFD